MPPESVYAICRLRRIRCWHSDRGSCFRDANVPHYLLSEGVESYADAIGFKQNKLPGVAQTLASLHQPPMVFSQFRKRLTCSSRALQRGGEEVQREVNVPRELIESRWNGTNGTVEKTSLQGRHCVGESMRTRQH